MEKPSLALRYGENRRLKWGLCYMEKKWERPQNGLDVVEIGAAARKTQVTRVA